MTKEQFLKRCETIYDMGYFNNRDISSMLRLACDTFLRLRCCYSIHKEKFDDISKLHQGSIAVDNISMFLDEEKLLASDNDVYNAMQLACVIDHPCQKCAEDKNAWHTRYAFCHHEKVISDIPF